MRQMSRIALPPIKLDDDFIVSHDFISEYETSYNVVRYSFYVPILQYSDREYLVIPELDNKLPGHSLLIDFGEDNGRESILSTAYRDRKVFLIDSDYYYKAEFMRSFPTYQSATKNMKDVAEQVKNKVTSLYSSAVSDMIVPPQKIEIGGSKSYLYTTFADGTKNKFVSRFYYLPYHYRSSIYRNVENGYGGFLHKLTKDPNFKYVGIRKSNNGVKQYYVVMIQESIDKALSYVDIKSFYQNKAKEHIDAMIGYLEFDEKGTYKFIRAHYKTKNEEDIPFVFIQGYLDNGFLILNSDTIGSKFKYIEYCKFPDYTQLKSEEDIVLETECIVSKLKNYTSSDIHFYRGLLKDYAVIMRSRWADRKNIYEAFCLIDNKTGNVKRIPKGYLVLFEGQENIPYVTHLTCFLYKYKNDLLTLVDAKSKEFALFDCKNGAFVEGFAQHYTYCVENDKYALFLKEVGASHFNSKSLMVGEIYDIETKERYKVEFVPIDEQIIRNYHKPETMVSFIDLKYKGEVHILGEKIDREGIANVMVKYGDDLSGLKNIAKHLFSYIFEDVLQTCIEVIREKKKVTVKTSSKEQIILL